MNAKGKIGKSVVMMYSTKGFSTQEELDEFLNNLLEKGPGKLGKIVVFDAFPPSEAESGRLMAQLGDEILKACGDIPDRVFFIKA